MAKRINLSLDDLGIESFAVGEIPDLAVYTTEPGSYNDTTAGCCAPPKPPPMGSLWPSCYYWGRDCA